jgi:FKBP-type peptidyl-prolyl cis-trans isomerases 1
MNVKMNLKLVVFILVAVVFASCESGIGLKSTSLKTQGDSASYAIGVFIGEQNKKQLESVPGKDDLDVNIIVQAFNDYLAKEDSKMNMEQAQVVIQGFFMEKAEKLKAKNISEGVEFLEKNKTKAGVITLESGMQYEILKEGTGPKPTIEQTVKCHYHGTLIDGTEFDSSVTRGEPAQFPVGGVIQGWTEALQLMPVGSKWKLYIPGNLAYGEQGAGVEIGPNQLLIFELELLEIVENQ